MSFLYSFFIHSGCLFPLCFSVRIVVSSFLRSECCLFLAFSMILLSASSFTTPQDPSCLRGAVTLTKSLPLEEETYSAPSGASTLRYNDPSEGHCDCLRRSGKRCHHVALRSACGDRVSSEDTPAMRVRKLANDSGEA